MIQCPNCETGMLWGIYLDIPPEMADGKAEWIACEPPEPDTTVTCPRCTQPAGTYEELYRKDAVNRRQTREERADQILNQVFVGEIADFLVMGLSRKGNYERHTFLADAWNQATTYQKNLRKDKLLPRLRSDFEESAEGAPSTTYIPKALGLRFEGEYLAAFPLTTGLVLENDKLSALHERMKNPDFNDPKGGKIESLHSGMYAKYFFKGSLKDYQNLPRLLAKDWIEKNAYDVREDEPWLELFDEIPAPWPAEHEDIEVTLCMPVEPRGMEASAPEDETELL